ncbi:type II toxin-antitoxin system RelE/ParE family toxin [Salinarimonas ramus]|uniref:type II toxin-antitoxin system RelE/ParE family toxin n=1 Tax=Salinarimonas ramus TaxID=690164 RepID=UPI001665D7CF|nr:type II toxin-antitoxin system RelE/ParE family toxin [Salinarimonas ramus]
MIVRWTNDATDDRSRILEHIAQHNPRAARRLDQRFSRAVSRLKSHPFSGQAGRVPGTRETIPHPSYRLVYEVDGDIVWIVAIVHTARLWPIVDDAAPSPADLR